MGKEKIIDINRAIELYKKYGSMNRAALSLDCSAIKLKQVLVENGIEIKKYKPAKWDIKFGASKINM
ncbi:MAG: hypothetical protein ACI8WT_001735 [Clostridium sp.]|jgi:hypothetical protein